MTVAQATLPLIKSFPLGACLINSTEEEGMESAFIISLTTNSSPISHTPTFLPTMSLAVRTPALIRHATLSADPENICTTLETGFSMLDWFQALLSQDTATSARPSWISVIGLIEDPPSIRVILSPSFSKCLRIFAI